jgi:hypothetical protein
MVIKIKGWRLAYNPFWDKIQCDHDGVIYGEFNEWQDAVDFVVASL